jgi:Hypothetical glycosyl hydrolase family 15
MRMAPERTRRIRVLLFAACALLALCGLARSAPAAGGAIRGHARPTIVWPYHRPVSGSVAFFIRGVPRGARAVFLSVGSRRIWSSGRAATARQRRLVLETRRLRNGPHILLLRVVYRGGRSVLTRKRIVVRNRSGLHGPVAHLAGLNVGAFGPPAAGDPGPSVAEFNRETYLYRSSWPVQDEADRYQFMVLAGNEYAEIPRLKAINPGLKFLLYQAIWVTNRDDYSWIPTLTGCTSYADDIANHRDWFLRDRSGALVHGLGKSDLYALDVGSSTYQQACAAHAGAVAKKYGFDGVFFDLVDGDPSLDVNGASLPEYPTRGSWEDAMGSALAYLGPALRAQGLLAFGNISGADSSARWERWVSHLDGVEEESWTDGDAGLEQQIPFWETKITELAWAMDHGKYEFVHSYNKGEAANTFGLAAMLLAANGRASYSTTNGATDDEYWFPEYNAARDLGAPAGPYRVLANGVYERAFARGIVLVNPTGRHIPAFWLGGGRYSGSGLAGAESVAMAPTSAVILNETG